ncbi:heavy metal translocating P-type ATPase [Trinickia dinghuensis]|uniref:heavy metal translocating P-type ATPase n=1 Tax=Trinickia dinghuensis TaxID=2291023 RepID=UPI001FE3A511|nr:heavy metal translocating P-type ATPase [Trinickia dinghuensis]
MLTPLPAASKRADGIETTIRIMQMDCPTEEALIRGKLDGMAAVTGLAFNLMQRTLTVVHAPGAEPAVLDAIRSLGFVPELPDPASRAQSIAEPARPWWPLALAALAAIVSEAATWFGVSPWLAGGFAGFALALSGIGTYRKGWIAVRNGNLNINALMSIAVTGAMALRQWPEAAMVMVLFALAERIEAMSLDRARNAIHALMQLAPEKATVQQSDGAWLSVEAKTVPIGARVRVAPGERVALDGEIVLGESSVNQAPITGESLPVDKGPGDAVFAGTINEAGSFEYRVTASADGTTLARIIHAVEQAQGNRAPTQRFVDRFARVYTPIVFACALLVAVVPPLVAGGMWREWIYRALVMLVIACPCALVISTPVAIVSGLAAAARRGILVKGGVYLEEGRKLAWLALDKTGTITTGAPAQTDFEPQPDVSAIDCRRIAAALAGRSDHPVSRAIAKAAAQASELEGGRATVSVDSFEALPGRGVAGSIESTRYWLGNARLARERGLLLTTVEARADELERLGRSVVLLMDEARVLALFAVADTVKQTSRAALAQLHALGIRTAMLTGDNAHTARAIAAEVGIDDVRGDQLPDDKLRAIESLSADGGAVGMVGDGINDAPALARARIGFAMGAMGSDAAIETADVALMDDDLRKIPAFVRLSRSTYAVLVQNIVFALAIKVIFLALTLMGLGTMWMAVFADAGASLIVVANGLRLLRR